MNRIKFIHLFFLPLFFVVGCETLSLSNTVEVIDDDFASYITIYSIKKSTNPLMLGSNQSIRGFIEKKDGSVIHQLYVNHIYSGSSWKFFQNANLAGGISLDFNIIDRDFKASANAFTEIFVLRLDDDFLRENSTGFPVKIFAKDGSTLLIDVTPEQIGSYLSTIDSIVSNIHQGN